MRELARNLLNRLPLGWKILAGVVVGSVLMGANPLPFGEGSPLRQGLRMSARVVTLSREYEQGLKDNAALEAELRFLQTDEGKRQAAWRGMGLTEPGWHSGLVIEQPRPEPRPMTRGQAIHAWLHAEQTRRTSQVREVREVLAAYSGARPRVEAPDQRNFPARSPSNEAVGGPEAPK